MTYKIYMIRIFKQNSNGIELDEERYVTPEGRIFQKTPKGIKELPEHSASRTDFEAGKDLGYVIQGFVDRSHLEKNFSRGDLSKIFGEN